MRAPDLPEPSPPAKAGRAGATPVPPEPGPLSRLGIHVYGTASVALGLIGLVWGDFASPWQPGLKGIPHSLAYVAALAVLTGGLAMQWPRSMKAGAFLLTLPNLAFATLWLAQCMGNWHPLNESNWLNLAEQLALLLAPIIAFAGRSARPTPREARTYQVTRVLFGLCAVAFGLAHFIFLKGTTRMAPQWLPPGPRFWALATGAGHLLAGIAIITGIQALLASRLLVAMILGFGALIWAPSLVAQPARHLFWAGNAINLALAGSAWIVADAIARQRRAVVPVASHA